MRIVYSLVAIVLIYFQCSAQQITSSIPFTNERGEQIGTINLAAKLNERYLLLAANKSYFYFGNDPSMLKAIDPRATFFQLFDTSSVKETLSLAYQKEQWEDVFLGYDAIIAVDSGVILAGHCLFEVFHRDFAIPKTHFFLLHFNSDMNPVAISFYEVPTSTQVPAIRNVFTTNLNGKTALMAEVDYGPEIDSPVFVAIGPMKQTFNTTISANKLSNNRMRSGFLPLKFSYVISKGEVTKHFYSTGFEIIDLDRQTLFYQAPDASIIMSPMMMVGSELCVVVADVDLQLMGSTNFRYVAVESNEVVRSVANSQLPYRYFVRKGSSHASDMEGIKNMNGSAHLIRFTP